MFNLSITIAVLCVEFGQGVVYAYGRHAWVTLLMTQLLFLYPFFHKKCQLACPLRLYNPGYQPHFILLHLTSEIFIHIIITSLLFLCIFFLLRLYLFFFSLPLFYMDT